MEPWVLVVGLVMLLVAVPVAGRRVWFLYRLITSGQPAPDRVAGVTGRLGRAVQSQVVEVFAQRKLLKWSVPGAAHFFVFWAFVILGSVYVEAFGILFTRNPEWAIPVVGHWEVLGFLQDFIAVMCLVGLATFAMIRLRNNPHTLGRKSRFSGSHLGGAWLILFMIVNVIWTMFLFRGAASAAGNLPYDSGAFVSNAIGSALDGLSHDALDVLEGVGLLLHIGVMLAFLVIVLNSKHLHIFVAPLNVLFKRQPKALGAVKPLTSAGAPVTLDDIEDLDEDTRLGIGSIEDFSWKGMLDFATCTECGRCQSQCPAWNTEKPLSPKMLIMNLRDHAFAKAPYLLTDESGRGSLDSGVLAEAERPLVGETEGPAWEPTGGAVIDTDVLWSCVTCGACVEQCPVDIEHVDHVVDMRRYQVLVESNFPAELNQLFKGMENKGNPWNMSPTARMDWAQGLDFPVNVVGEDVESLDEVEWLFWVGCAGAYEDRQKKTTRAVAELLHTAGVSFAVLGNGETCNGDQARRAGNEFVFQGLAQQNIETFKEYKVKKVVSTCAHCFNTLKNEYKEFGIELEVVHHTQLLNRLVREGKLTPLPSGAGAHQRKITYHDPCYIGRHNGVYAPPRELLQVLPGAEFVEMPRNSERSFCCGAGGARMWMEENLGERINLNRTTEAVGTGADQIAVGCPFCRVMLSDGLTAAIDQGEARQEVEVLDVAQMLLASVKGEMATRYAPGSGGSASPEGTAAAAASAGGGTALKERPAETPQPDTAVETVETPESSPVAKATGGGSSLFDTPTDDEPAPAAPPPSGGSLFDTPADRLADQTLPCAADTPFADFAPLLEQVFAGPADPAAEAARIDAFLLDLLARRPPHE
uniref:(Fe-S)-binding protein n=1 Tax=uncultured Nocardioides sp. TaxID=198441 RepID=UPI002631CF00